METNNNQNETSAEKTAKILDKIKKLMKLQASAEKIGSIHEAEKAATMIQKLLTEYNLSMDSVGDLDADDNKREQVTEDRDMSWFVPTIGGQWKMKLAVTISRFNFCKIVITNTKKRTFMIIGTQANIDVCKYLIEMLTEKFVAIGKREYQNYAKDLYYGQKAISYDAYVRRFCEGANVGLYHKLRAEAKEVQKEYGEARVISLVIFNDKAIENYIAEKIGPLGKGKASSNYKQDDVTAKGYRTGRNVQLNSGAVGTPTKNLALGN